MAAVTVRVTGLREAQQAIQRLGEGCQEVSRTGLVVGATAPYSRFVEEGTRRMRARPYLRPAVAEVERTLRAQLVAALPHGARPVAAALTGLGGALVRAAQRVVPVRTGNLRRSIYWARTGRAGERW